MPDPEKRAELLRLSENLELNENQAKKVDVPPKKETADNARFFEVQQNRPPPPPPPPQQSKQPQKKKKAKKIVITNF